MSPEEKLAIARQCLSGAKLGRHGWYRATCLFCVMRKGTPDKRWSWGYLPETGEFHCFRCGMFGFFGKVASKDYRPPVLDRPIDHELAEAQRLPENFIELAGTRPVYDDLFGEIDPYEAPRAFLKRRLVSREVARANRIGVCMAGCRGKNPECKPDERCMSCRFRKRVIIPIMGPSGEAQIGFVARTWGKTAMVNYLYPKGMPRGAALFNHAEIWRETDEPVLVCEGVFDALPYWPNAVACLGKPTDDQIESLTTAKRPIAVCLDGDAWREGKVAAMRLQYDGARAGYVKLPPTEDPNTVDRRWLTEQARKCIAA